MDEKLGISEMLYVELLDALDALSGNSLEQSRENDKQVNVTSESRLPNTLTTKERKNIKNIGESFYEGLKTTYDKVKESMSLREKMLTNVKKAFKLPVYLYKGTKTVVKKTSGFLAKLLLFVEILGAVYLLFKNWVDKFLNWATSGTFGDGAMSFISTVWDNVGEAFSDIKNILTKIKEGITEILGGDTLREGFMNTIIDGVSETVKESIRNIVDSVSSFIFSEKSLEDDYQKQAKEKVRREAVLALSASPETRTLAQLEAIVKYNQLKGMEDLAKKIYTSLRGNEGYSDVSEGVVYKSLLDAGIMARNHLGTQNDVLGYNSLVSLLLGGEESKKTFDRFLLDSLQMNGFYQKVNYSDWEDRIDWYLKQILESQDKRFVGTRKKKVGYWVGPDENKQWKEVESDELYLTEAGILEASNRAWNREKQLRGKVITGSTTTLASGDFSSFLQQNETEEERFRGAQLREIELQKQRAEKMKNELGDEQFISEIKKLISIDNLQRLLENFTSGDSGAFKQFADLVTGATRDGLGGIVQAILNKANISFAAQNPVDAEIDASKTTNISTIQNQTVHEDDRVIVNISAIDIRNVEDIMKEAHVLEGNILTFLARSNGSLEALNKRMENYLKEYNKQDKQTSKGGGTTIVYNAGSSNNTFNSIPHDSKRATSLCG